jgi:hypothetical protein
MFSLLLLLLFIFVIYLKENDFFFFLLKNMGTSRVCMQKYPKSTGIQKISGTDTILFLENPYFIAYNSILNHKDTQPILDILYYYL